MTNDLPVIQAVKAEDHGFRTVLYGDYGVGKTTLATSLLYDPMFQPGIILDTDEGLTSVQHLSGLNRISLRDVSGIVALSNELMKPNEKRAEGYRGLKTIIWDTLTATRDIIMDGFARERAEDPKNCGTFSENRWALQQAEYGWAANAIRFLITVMAQTNLNVVMTAGSEQQTDGSWSFDVNEKLRREIARKADNIWCVANTNDTVSLLVRRRGAYQIKTRGPKFSDKLVAMSLEGVKSEEVERRTGWLKISMNKDSKTVSPSLADLYKLYLKEEK